MFLYEFSNHFGKSACHILRFINESLHKSTGCICGFPGAFLKGLLLYLLFHEILLCLVFCCITLGNCRIFCAGSSLRLAMLRTMELYAVTIGICPFPAFLFDTVDTGFGHLASCNDRITTGILVFIGFIQLMSDLSINSDILSCSLSSLLMDFRCLFDLKLCFSCIRFSGTKLFTHGLRTGSLILELPGMRPVLCLVFRFYAPFGALIPGVNPFIHLSMSFHSFASSFASVISESFVVMMR